MQQYKICKNKYINLFSNKATAQIGTDVRVGVVNAGLLARSQFASGRSCDRPTGSRFSAVFLGPRVNAELVPKFHVALHASHACEAYDITLLSVYNPVIFVRMFMRSPCCLCIPPPLILCRGQYRNKDAYDIIVLSVYCVSSMIFYGYESDGKNALLCVCPPRNFFFSFAVRVLSKESRALCLPLYPSCLRTEIKEFTYE
jgi:hypothetical protein